jgi:hypothetical protein
MMTETTYRTAINTAGAYVLPVVAESKTYEIVSPVMSAGGGGANRPPPFFLVDFEMAQ